MNSYTDTFFDFPIDKNCRKGYENVLISRFNRSNQRTWKPNDKGPMGKKGETQALKRMHENCFHISGDNGFLMWIYKTLKLLALCCCCVRGIHNLAKKQFTLMVQNPKRIRRRKKCTTPLEIALFSPIPANGNGEGTSEDTGTIRDSGGGICNLRYGRKDLQRPAPSLPAWRRQCLVVYCNGRCTGAAGRRTRPHPAFWELRSLPRIYEVINEIKNAAGKRKKATKMSSSKPS